MRLERLKICATSSGEMPVFKLKPQKSDQDGSFLLIIQCGTESSSMSIKVPLCSALALNLGAFLFFLLQPEFWLGLCPESEWGCTMARPFHAVVGLGDAH